MFLKQAPSPLPGAAVLVVGVEAVVVDATIAGADVVEDEIGEESLESLPPTSWTSAQFVKTSLQHNLSPMVASQLSAALGL